MGQGASKVSQEASNIAQEASRRAQEACMTLSDGPREGKILKKLWFFYDLKVLSFLRHGGPKRAQDCPKTAQYGFKKAPRRAKTTPRAAQEGFREAQDGPREGSKEGP